MFDQGEGSSFAVDETVLCERMDGVLCTEFDQGIKTESALFLDSFPNSGEPGLLDSMKIESDWKKEKRK
jgi:hypothetical protein